MEQKCTPRERFGPFKIISTDGDLPFDVVGFLQPLLLELNTRGIKAGPQCAAVFDHLFIYEKDIAQAEVVIDQFIEKAKKQAPEHRLLHAPLGELYLLTGREEEGKAALRRAVAVDPRDARARALLEGEEVPGREEGSAHDDH